MPEPFHDAPIYSAMLSAAAGSAPVQGIDVASYQGSPDWAKVYRSGIRFAYVKASEGVRSTYSTTDAQFHGANAAGIATGLYHYAKPALSPESNAGALAAQVNRLGAVAGHLPPCLDLEEGTGVLEPWARAFIAKLRALTGCRRVMVYSGASFFKDHIGEAWMDPDTGIWVAHYGRAPGKPAYLTDRVAVHQYSSTGQVPGITGHVDLNQSIWPLSRLVVQASSSEEGNETVNLSVTQTLPAGTGVQVPVMVPPYEGKRAVFRIATGWTDAAIKAVYFVRDAGPNLTPAQEQWGGSGPFTLVHDDRPWWPLPEGTTQISLEYDSAHPIGVLITYTPSAAL